jgi:hypothetical protein
MKNVFKTLLIASCLCYAAVAVSAQEAESAPKATLADFHVGDTVVIKKDHERYLTGEKMSKWVYNVEHTILQVGGIRRHQEGILLKGIYSWVLPDDIINKTTHPEEAAANQEAKAAAERQAEEQKEAAQEARQDSIQAVKDSVKDAKEEAARQDSIARAERAAALKAYNDSVEQTRQDSIAMRAYRDSVAQATRDSLRKVYEENKDSQEAIYVITQKPQEIFNCNRFTIGLRGGAASLMQNTEKKMGNWHVGWDVMLDLQYAHYWKKFGKKMQYGLLVGVSAGFTRSHLESGVLDEFDEQTTSGNIHYTVKAQNVKEYDGQLQLEVPLMFSMIHENGFFMNIGPRFALPVYSPYNQKITQPDIIAYFEEEGVTVPNAMITGQVSDQQADSNGKWKASTLNVILGAELGYEFTFKNKNSLGIGVYGNYGLYSLYKNDTDNKSLINIAEVPDANKPAVVNVLSATDTYAKGVGFFDVGLKLAYHFNWWK